MCAQAVASVLEDWAVNTGGLRARSNRLIVHLLAALAGNALKTVCADELRHVKQLAMLFLLDKCVPLTLSSMISLTSPPDFRVRCADRI